MYPLQLRTFNMYMYIVLERSYNTSTLSCVDVPTYLLVAFSTCSTTLRQRDRVVDNTLVRGADDPNLLAVRFASPSFARRQR